MSMWNSVFDSREFAVLICNSRLDNLFLLVTVVFLYGGTGWGYQQKRPL